MLYDCTLMEKKMKKKKKHCYAVRSKFVQDKCLTSLIKLLLETKASICSTINENVLF